MAHRHRFGDSVHLEWACAGELLRCVCGRVWLRRYQMKQSDQVSK